MAFVNNTELFLRIVMAFVRLVGEKIVQWLIHCNENRTNKRISLFY